MYSPAVTYEPSSVYCVEEGRALDLKRGEGYINTTHDSLWRRVGSSCQEMCITKRKTLVMASVADPYYDR